MTTENTPAPELRIVWHTTPESVHTAYWQPVLEAEGIAPDEIASSTIHAESVDGETVELEEGAVLDAMRSQKCWGFFDGEHRVIHAWAAPDADPATVIRLLAHEIGHGTGEQREEDIEEEARAEAFGVVAAQAFSFWQQRAPAPTTEAPQAPTQAQLLRLWDHARNFVEHNELTCMESVYQRDSVVEQHADFVGDACRLVGFMSSEDDEA
jgi:hypothetical protein